MRVREAKDFLVAQTAGQAALEGVPLSELEKRMMYFTEGPGAIEDPTTLNDEFEAEYDNAEYEKKISTLMSHAQRRLKKEDAAKAGYWDNAVKCLQKGDHYILVLYGNTEQSGALPVSPKSLLWLVMFLLPLLILLAVVYFATRRFAPPRGAAMHILQVLFVALLVVAIFFPKALTPIGNVVGRYWDWLDKDERQREQNEK